MPGAPQTCIKGNGILYSVTGSQDFPRGQDFAGGQGHWRASHCRRAGLHGGQGIKGGKSLLE